MYFSKVAGTGSYVPERCLTNFDLERMVDTSDEWIRTRTGIIERHIAREDEATSDLTLKAAWKAMEAAGVGPLDLDLILVGTVTPTMPFPSTACFLQDALQAKNAAAMDISAACSGFIYGLSVADAMLRSGSFRTVLLTGAETLSKITDWTDRNTCILFGDGAGTVVLQKTTGEARILSTHLYADGSRWQELMMPGGGSRHPISVEIIHQNLHKIKMPNGNEVFKMAVRAMEEAAITALKVNGYDVSDVDLFIPHQANARIVHAVAQRLSLPIEKVYVNIDRYGNTSSASIPIALDEAVRNGSLKRGDLVLLGAFGGGLTWGSALIRW
ncbi:MAG: ketoacyl-ACP synthase III [candidate division NC10 bacterium]|nr:ketoacyl-ACP synthase III [candidate division NC10 bacterium]